MVSPTAIAGTVSGLQGRADVPPNFAWTSGRLLSCIKLSDKNCPGYFEGQTEYHQQFRRWDAGPVTNNHKELSLLTFRSLNVPPLPKRHIPTLQLIYHPRHGGPNTRQRSKILWSRWKNYEACTRQESRQRLAFLHQLTSSGLQMQVRSHFSFLNCSHGNV